MRIAESLSKMKLQPFATEADVEEALRLFQVSTLDAAMSGSLSGEDGQCCIGLQLPSRSLRRVCVCVCGWEMWEMAFMALRVASGCSCNLSPPRGRRLHDAGGPRDAVPY